QNRYCGFFSLCIFGNITIYLFIMVDTVITTMGNDNDDWEVAVDTGEFDKRLEEQEQDRAAKQVILRFSLFIY
ncbi:unnamed protein product, partial [Rotaria magnacalcarata]